MTDGDSKPEVLLVSADLFLGSRIQGAVTSAGATLKVVARGDSAVVRLSDGSVSLVLIDLETPGVDTAEVVRAANASCPTPSVAYGPHVKEHLLNAARDAGCSEVLSRGKFDASIGQILNRHLASDS